MATTDDHRDDVPPLVPPGDLDAALAAVADVEGWLTESQARRLWAAGRAAPPGGRIVEIGSFRGRSTIVLALASPQVEELAAIDPHAGNDRGPQEIHGYEDEANEDFSVFQANLRAAGVAERVRHIRRFSADALPQVSGDIDVLYIDGAHRFRPARADLVQWGQRVAPGGRLLVHDSFSSVGVTLALLTSVVLDGRFEYVGRTGSLAEYRAAHLRPVERVTKVLRTAADLPWFLRNVLVKVAIVTGARPIARALGHDGESWPY